MLALSDDDDGVGDDEPFATPVPPDDVVGRAVAWLEVDAADDEFVIVVAAPPNFASLFNRI